MDDDESSKFKVVLLHPCGKHAVKLPKDISYNNLLAYVKKKVDAAKGKVNADIRLSYKDGTMLLDIVDDDDVKYFIHDVCGNKDQAQKLFISLKEVNSEVKSSYASNRSLIDLNIPLLPELVNQPTPKVEAYSFHNQDDSLPIWQKNSFKHMPLPPKAPNTVIKCIDRNIQGKKATTFHKYREFVNKADCMFNIGKKSLIERFEYVVIKSEPTRYSVKCTKQGCPWKIYTRRVNGGDQFYVSTVNDVHTCSRTEFCPNHRNATMKLLSQLLYEKMKDHSRVYTVKDIQTDLRVDWKIDLSYKRVWGGRNLSFELLNGKPEDSFAQLPYYCHNLKLANPGTVTHIETDDAGRFKLVFIAFGVAIRSFIAFMRPLLIIDAAHLKGKYKGTNLLAVGMDGNNQIIPIATGVCQGETGESWTLFLRKLKECIGVVPGLAIISDRHQSIIQACNIVFPESFHGNCCRHLMMNCNLKGELVRYLFWKSCKAYSIEVFERTMKELRAKRPQARHRNLNLLTGPLGRCNKGCTRVKTGKLEASQCVLFTKQWKLSGLPCGHVCVVCRVEGLTNCNQWALPWFTKTNLKGTYHEMVFPLPDEANWHNPGNLPKLKPPVMVKQQSGRPKNKDRFPSKNEEPKVKQCGRCGCKSHTREACMQPLPRSANGNPVYDNQSGRKRKASIKRDVIIEPNPGNETEVIYEPNTDVDEEYFENGRIYADWDDLDWFGEPSANLYKGDEVWGGAASSSGINLNSYPESGNPYHLDDF
ncbi:transposase, MuDR, MULE transposase domain protein [Artemisia annua]|uniref:Transposase, MuDR, MULE transposase domain protein n=1 Tax=Artemisia annua TaxID=35608 RepID=A0A2U1P0B1_ARTAN|nr:transposase, MuDR, MULE transposase domain protein [Artemisia annua]